MKTGGISLAAQVWFQRLALVEETFVGLCESATESLGLTAPQNAA